MSVSTFKVDVLARCREIVEDPAFTAVRRWKEAHPYQKVVGCYPVYSPIELVHAAGALPVGIIGGGNQVEIAHADARFQSFICSIVKSTLELGLTGRLDLLDGIFFHSICDPARNLAAVFARNFPNLRVEYIHYPQNLASPTAVTYFRAELERIRAALAEITGRSIADEALHDSIVLYNRWRTRIRHLYELRQAAPEKLPAAEAYTLLRAGTLMPVEEHLPLLEAALRKIPGRTAKRQDRIRVVVEGAFCEQPPVDLIAAIEQAGCYLLDDDLLLGWRWFTGDVPEDGDPLEALATSYIDRSVYCGTKHDTRAPKAAHLVQRVRALGADAVLFLCAKFCEPALFDYALYRRALEEAGIPHLFLEFEEKMWIFDRARGEVETFVESMLFG
ncbi:MAG: 2-hydroxyacyl-CoA dehydratase [Armatimonadota bacterium]|nr:2-hydroxyacyl-CoA dehydratase [Armatimonadota bacterium]